MQGEGGVAGSQPMSTAVLYAGAQKNFGDLTPYDWYICSATNNTFYNDLLSGRSYVLTIMFISAVFGCDFYLSL